MTLPLQSYSHVWRATFTGHGRASLETTDMSEMSAALPFSARQFSQVARLFNYMQVPFISTTTFQTYQNNFLFPVIIDAWETEQQDMSSDAFIKYLSWIRQNATELVQSVDFLHPRTEEGGDQREEWGRG